MGLRSIEEHRALLVALVAGRVTAPETVVVSAASAADGRHLHRRVLAADVVAPTDLPTADNSQMDGYAVRAADLDTASADAPVALTVAERIAAGVDGGARVHRPGTATPIMTGAPIPRGADAVVKIEHSLPDAFFPEPVAADAVVAFQRDVEPGAFVRRRGSDVRAGAVLLAVGTRLGAAQLGALAGNGITAVSVRRRPRILVITTGAEVRPPGTALEPGQLHDANGTSLAAALTAIGAAVTAVLCPSDDPAQLVGILAKHAHDADIIVTVGAASRGAHEVVRDVFEPAGVAFAEIGMQPGGPQGYGMASVAGRAAPVPVIAVPGNPVSALVSFEMFLRPVVATLTGDTTTTRRLAEAWPTAPLAQPTAAPPGKDQLRRAVVDDDGRLAFVGGPGSHLLHAYASATALVRVRAARGSYAEGDPCEYWRLDD